MSFLPNQSLSLFIRHLTFFVGGGFGWGHNFRNTGRNTWLQVQRELEKSGGNEYHRFTWAKAVSLCAWSSSEIAALSAFRIIHASVCTRGAWVIIRNTWDSRNKATTRLTNGLPWIRKIDKLRDHLTSRRNSLDLRYPARDCFYLQGTRHKVALTVDVTAGRWARSWDHQFRDRVYRSGSEGGLSVRQQGQPTLLCYDGWSTFKIVIQSSHTDFEMLTRHRSEHSCPTQGHGCRWTKPD